MPDVLTQRAQYQAKVEGRTLVDALADTVAAHGDEPAVSDRHHRAEGEAWRTLTWTRAAGPGARRRRGADLAGGADR